MLGLGPEHKYIVNTDKFHNILIHERSSEEEPISQQQLQRQQETATNVAIIYSVGGIFILITITYFVLDHCVDENVPIYLAIFYTMPYNCVGCLLAAGIVLICHPNQNSLPIRRHCKRWGTAVFIFTALILTQIFSILVLMNVFDKTDLSSYLLLGSYCFGLAPLYKVKIFMDKWILSNPNLEYVGVGVGMASCPMIAMTMKALPEFEPVGLGLSLGLEAKEALEILESSGGNAGAEGNDSNLTLDDDGKLPSYTEAMRNCALLGSVGVVVTSDIPAHKNSSCV